MGNTVQEFRDWLESQRIHLGRMTEKRQQFIDDVISRAVKLQIPTNYIPSTVATTPLKKDSRVTYAEDYQGQSKKPVATVMTKDQSMQTDADHGQHDEQRMKDEQQKRLSSV